MELIALVRGALAAAPEAALLGHCVTCPTCASTVEAMALLRRARGLSVRPGLEPARAPGSFH